jgi:dimeric type glycyl-tRNA synthetase
MHPKVWEASGHLEGFTDPLVDCKVCKRRFRADHLLEAKGIKPKFEPDVTLSNIPCPECGGELTGIRQFNLMFKTFMGAVEDQASTVYLRPETAQGIFVNFQNIRESMRKSIPFGIAQVGKAFRNEITPGNFIFRTREFEQMEMEFLVPMMLRIRSINKSGTTNPASTAKPATQAIMKASHSQPQSRLTMNNPTIIELVIAKNFTNFLRVTSASAATSIKNPAT